MALEALDVIWIHDDLIRPPGPKMMVCLAPAEGLFGRINSKGWRPGSVSIGAKDHHFLDHDSYIECGAVFELDDYAVEQSIERGRGIIGQISPALAAVLVDVIAKAPGLRETDKAGVTQALLSAMPPA